MKITLKIMSVSFVLGAIYLTSSVSSAATSSVVFHGLVEGDPFFRAPQFVVANDGSLLAFAENRETLNDPGRGSGLISVVMKRSTDMGATWSPMQVLQDGNLHDFSGVAPVVDALTGEVILTFNRVPNVLVGGAVPTGTGSNTFNTFVKRSTDNGITWTPASNITSQVKDPSSEVFVPSPASGIQLRWQTDPSRNGRLIIPAIQSGGGETRDITMFNDASGADGAWQVGTLTPSSGISVNEADIVELTNGDLLMDARPNDLLLPRQRYTSSDGGMTWSQPVPSDILDPNVDTGLARYTAKRDGDDRNRIVYSSPLGIPLGAANGRANVGIWTSYDEGKTFINPVQVGTEADGYSNLQKLPDGRLGLMYETTELGGGVAQFDIDRVMFVNIDVLDLEGQSHQRQLTHYDGFGNQIDRLRGGMGWSGSWSGNATVVESGQLNYTGFKYATEQGRVDLINGQTIDRELATSIDLNSDSTTYISMLISQEQDTSPNSGSEFLDIQLSDILGNVQAAFGVSSDEGFSVSELGSGAGTVSGLLDRSSSYFLVAKIVSQDDQIAGNFDQIFLKVFKSGTHVIPDSEDLFAWTAVGGTGENSGALIDRITIESGLEVTWSIDEVRIGTTYGSVASNIEIAIDGDLNGDGFVGVDDLNIVLSKWNQNVTPGDLMQGDVTGEGFVGVDDLNIILSNWNLGVSPPAVGGNIPEPTSLALLGMGCVFVLCRQT